MPSAIAFGVWTAFTVFPPREQLLQLQLHFERDHHRVAKDEPVHEGRLFLHQKRPRVDGHQVLVRGDRHLLRVDIVSGVCLRIWEGIEDTGTSTSLWPLTKVNACPSSGDHRPQPNREVVGAKNRAKFTATSAGENPVIRAT